MGRRRRGRTHRFRDGTFRSRTGSHAGIRCSQRHAAGRADARTGALTTASESHTMQRRRFNVSTLAGLLSLAALSACGRKLEAPVPSASAAPAPATAPTPSSAPAAASDAYALAATGNGFSVGPLMSAHTVYVFFD